MTILCQSGKSDIRRLDEITSALIPLRHEQPGARFTVLTDPPRLNRADASADLVLLFAVLTCVPDGVAQRGVIDEIRRVLKPGGWLYLSDYYLQKDERNVAR